MNMSMPNEMEPGVQTRKMPQDNPEVWQGIRELLEDPETYMARMRETSLREARVYVDRRMREKLAAQEAARSRRFGHRLLQLVRPNRDKTSVSQ